MTVFLLGQSHAPLPYGSRSLCAEYAYTMSFCWYLLESSVHLFVGSLKPETGEKELRGMLVSQGLEVIACSLLPKKAEWQKHYAAFRVVIRTAHKENIFKEDIWPEGVEVREWYFKPR